MVLALLKVRHIKLRGFPAAQPTTQQNRKQRSIAFAFESGAIGHLPKCLGLLCGKPVAEANAQLLCAFYSTNSSSRWGLLPPHHAYVAISAFK
jgi:hypothetical protein